jgi:hypothetical protein
MALIGLKSAGNWNELRPADSVRCSLFFDL